MKTIKICGIFIAIVAVVVGILYFANGGSSSNNGSGGNDWTTHYKTKIDNKWKGIVWDTKVYDDNINILNVAQKKLKSGYSTLYEYNWNRAVTNLDSALMKEFTKTDCNRAIVEKWYNGVKYIAADNLAKDNPTVTKLQKTYSLYCDILKLCNAPIAISPNFDVESDSWNHFSNYRKGKMDLVNSYKGSKYYKYIHKVKEINDGLNSIPGKLDRVEISFMGDLERQIEQAYSADSCKKSKDDLQNVYSVFVREHPNDDGDRRSIKHKLRTFIQNYSG